MALHLAFLIVSLRYLTLGSNMFGMDLNLLAL